MRTSYDDLGPNGFRDLCHALLREYLGPAYVPFSTGGSDGGRDGEFDGTPRRAPEWPGYWIAQFKHHDVAQIGAGKARSKFLAEVGKELAAWSTRAERVPDVLLFITNVPLTAVPFVGTHAKLGDIAKKAPKGIGRVEFWGRANLDTEIDAIPEVRLRYRTAMADIMAELLKLRDTIANRLASPGVAVRNDVDLVTNVLYTEEKRATLLLAEIGNRRPVPVTIRRVCLRLDGVGELYPDEPFTSLEVGGYRWAGTHPETIAAHQLVRLVWLLPDHNDVKSALDGGQPITGEVRIDCFPDVVLTGEVTLYTIRRLREIGGAGAAES